MKFISTSTFLFTLFQIPFATIVAMDTEAAEDGYHTPDENESARSPPSPGTPESSTPPTSPELTPQGHFTGPRLFRLRLRTNTDSFSTPVLHGWPGQAHPAHSLRQENMLGQAVLNAHAAIVEAIHSEEPQQVQQETENITTPQSEVGTPTTSSTVVRGPN